MKSFRCPEAGSTGQWNFNTWQFSGKAPLILMKKDLVEACDCMWFDPPEHSPAQPRSILPAARGKGTRYNPVAASYWRESAGQMVLIIDSVIPVQVVPAQATEGQAIIRAMVVKTRATADGTGGLDGDLEYWHLGPGSGGFFYIGHYKVVSWLGIEVDNRPNNR